MPLPFDVRELIRRTFGSADMRKKATLDAEILHDRYRLEPTRWDEAAFRRMAKDKGWAGVTIEHRWYVFSRLLSAIKNSSGAGSRALQGPSSEAFLTLPEANARNRSRTTAETKDGFLSEDDVKRFLVDYLTGRGWDCAVKWGHEPGIDVEARRGSERWIVEVKGQGSLNPMRVNYFLGVLGETLQRMSDDKAKYSIALPDIEQFRRLWQRLPALTKSRTGITALFIDAAGQVTEER